MAFSLCIWLRLFVQVQRWEGHRRGVNAAVYGPTTGFAYTAGRDLTIRQWSRREATSTRSFEGHDLNVAALALSPDERLLFSGARDTSVRLWDVGSGTQIAINKTPRNLVTALRWVPGESSSVLQASEDLRLRLWDVRSGGPQQSASLKATSTMLGHSNIPLCCDVSGDGLSFLTCHKGFDGMGCELRVWDRRQGATRQVLRGHQQAVQSCAFIGNVTGQYGVSGGSDKTLRLWECSGSAGETAAPPSACLATHYFPSAVQAVTPLSDLPVPAGGGAASSTEKFDLNFDDDEVSAKGSKADPIQIAVGCFDGSLHVMDVDIGDGASSSFSVVFSSGGEAGGSSGDVGSGVAGGGEECEPTVGASGGEFSNF
jgi:WD40 repeat protein